MPVSEFSKFFSQERWTWRTQKKKQQALAVIFSDHDVGSPLLPQLIPVFQPILNNYLLHRFPPHMRSVSVG
jgi:hypothetical protein